MSVQLAAVPTCRTVGRIHITYILHHDLEYIETDRGPECALIPLGEYFNCGSPCKNLVPCSELLA
jgi:hypothetical protein